MKKRRVRKYEHWQLDGKCDNGHSLVIRKQANTGVILSAWCNQCNTGYEDDPDDPDNWES